MTQLSQKEVAMDNPNNHEGTSFNIGLINLISSVVGLGIVGYFAWQVDAWQIWRVLGVMMASTLTVGVGVWLLIKQNQPVWGGWLIIAPTLLSIIVLGSLIADLGFLLAVITIVFVLLTARGILPRPQQRLAISLGILVSILIILVDQINISYRMPVTNQQFWAATTLGLIVVLAYIALSLQHFRDYSLQTKLVVGFIGISIFSVGAVALFANQVGRENLIDNANQRLLTAANQTSTKVDAFINTTLNTVNVEARLPELLSVVTLADNKPQPAFEQTLTLFALSRKDPTFILSYALLNANGINLMDTSGKNVNRDESGQDYFVEAQKTGQPYVSPVLFTNDYSEPVLYFCAPIKNAAGQFMGLLRVTYRARILQTLLREGDASAGQDSFAILFDENTLILGHSNTPDTLYLLAASLPAARVDELVEAQRLAGDGRSHTLVNLPEFATGLANAGKQPFFTVRQSAFSSELNQVVVVSLQRQPWQVAFVQPQEAFLAPAKTQSRNIMLLAILVIMVGAVVAVVLARQFTQPVIQLTHIAQRISAGQLSLQAPVTSGDETGQLAQAFNSMTRQLRLLIDSLEDQVRERTVELALSIEVGQQAAAIRNLDNLLPTITQLIRDRFHLYYVQIYFVDDSGQNLLLVAATGEVGQQLLAQKHSLPLGTGSIVGQAVVTRQAVVVPDINPSLVFAPGAPLSATRSELAVPLLIEDQTIGVLNMKSDRARTFTKENQVVFEAMATQLAISIDSARQWTRAQDAQQKLQGAVQRLTRDSWTQTLASRKKALAYSYNRTAVVPQDPQVVGGDVSAPLVVQNQPIGELAVTIPKNKTLTAEERALIQAVAQQLSAKAETLRLFEEIQQQATREQLARQIIDKIRASRNIEAALNTAAQELNRALGITKTEIKLQVAPTSLTQPQEEPTPEIGR